MKPAFAAFGAGVLFAVGLVVSGMTQPAKVVGFLDVFGNWDPSLAFVMGGAVVVAAILFRLVRRRSQPVFGHCFWLPTRSDIEPRLILGGALFGIGWGLVGYCPGPALVALPTATTTVVVFGAAMAAGMFLFHAFDRYLASRAQPEEACAE